MTLDEQIAQLKYWLGPSTLRNTWTMRNEPGRTVVHVFRRQWFKHIVKKALKIGLPVTIDKPQVFALWWQPCANCGQFGDAHNAERKCLFGSTFHRAVPIRVSPA